MPENADRGRGGAIEFSVSTLAFGGEGVARRAGKTCFIAGALPGERVEAEIRERRRQYDRASLLRVLTPSPDRIRPLCPHTSLCGGCSIQSLRYEAQLRSKADSVRECLQRIGGMKVAEPNPPLPSPALVGYRNKMEFSFAPRAWWQKGPPPAPWPSPAVGLHVPGRYDAVFDLEACALASPDSVRILDCVRRFTRNHALSAYRSTEDQGLLRHLIVRQGTNSGDLLAGLVVRYADPVLNQLGPILCGEIPRLTGLVLVINEKRATIARGDEEQLLFGRPYFHERLLGLTFRLQLQSFFQTNTWGAEVLLTAVRRMVADSIAELGLGGPTGGRLLDLYCGAGTLGLAVADLFDEVVGVESVESSVLDARANATQNRINNTFFHLAPAEEWLRQEARLEDSAYRVAVVDPPRAGLHPRALSGLVGLSPAWILYVSCNPSTLARDAALLKEGGYEPRELQIVDLFPHTAHIESILLLQKSRPAES